MQKICRFVFGVVILIGVTSCTASDNSFSLTNCPQLIQKSVKSGKAEQVCTCLASDIAINPETKAMKKEISKAFLSSSDAAELRENLGLYTNSATTLGLIESCIYKSDAKKPMFQ